MKFDSYLDGGGVIWFAKANIRFGLIWEYLFASEFCAIFDSYSYLVFDFFATFYHISQAPSVPKIDNMQHAHLVGKLTRI